MPRELFSSAGWKALKVNLEDLQCGDILFVRNKENEKLLSHVALIIGVNQIFHCTPKFGTAAIETTEDFFTHYEQKLNFKQMLRYIDPRNKVLREKEQGLFISD